MEINGRSTVSYLVRTPRIPLFMLILIGLEAKNRLAFQGRRGIASVVRWNFRPVIFGVEIRSASELRFIIRDLYCKEGKNHRPRICSLTKKMARFTPQRAL